MLLAYSLPDLRYQNFAEEVESVVGDKDSNLPERLLAVDNPAVYARDSRSVERSPLSKSIGPGLPAPGSGVR